MNTGSSQSAEEHKYWKSYFGQGAAKSRMLKLLIKVPAQQHYPQHINVVNPEWFFLRIRIKLGLFDPDPTKSYESNRIRIPLQLF